MAHTQRLPPPPGPPVPASNPVVRLGHVKQDARASIQSIQDLLGTEVLSLAGSAGAVGVSYLPDLGHAVDLSFTTVDALKSGRDWLRGKLAPWPLDGTAIAPSLGDSAHLLPAHCSPTNLVARSRFYACIAPGYEGAIGMPLFHPSQQQQPRAFGVPLGQIALSTPPERAPAHSPSQPVAAIRTAPTPTMDDVWARVRQQSGEQGKDVQIALDAEKVRKVNALKSVILKFIAEMPELLELPENRREARCEEFANNFALDYARRSSFFSLSLDSPPEQLMIDIGTYAIVFFEKCVAMYKKPVLPRPSPSPTPSLQSNASKRAAPSYPTGDSAASKRARAADDGPGSDGGGGRGSAPSHKASSAPGQDKLEGTEQRKILAENQRARVDAPREASDPREEGDVEEREKKEKERHEQEMQARREERDREWRLERERRWGPYQDAFEWAQWLSPQLNMLRIKDVLIAPWDDPDDPFSVRELIGDIARALDSGCLLDKIHSVILRQWGSKNYDIDLWLPNNAAIVSRAIRDRNTITNIVAQYNFAITDRLQREEAEYSRGTHSRRYCGSGQGSQWGDDRWAQPGRGRGVGSDDRWSASPRGR